jgi:hypothetical protein
MGGIEVTLTFRARTRVPGTLLCELLRTGKAGCSAVLERRLRKIFFTSSGWFVLPADKYRKPRIRAPAMKFIVVRRFRSRRHNSDADSGGLIPSA